MDEIWLYHYELETKQLSMRWRHSNFSYPKNTSAKFRWKRSRFWYVFFWWWVSKRHPPHWLHFKGPNYQRGVLFNSDGAIEGHFKGNTHGKFIKGVSFLHDNATGHRALATQCLIHPPYCPDLTPSDYHLFPGQDKKLEGRHFSSEPEVIVAARDLIGRTIFW